MHSECHGTAVCGARVPPHVASRVANDSGLHGRRGRTAHHARAQNVSLPTRASTSRHSFRPCGRLQGILLLFYLSGRFRYISSSPTFRLALNRLCAGKGRAAVASLDFPRIDTVRSGARSRHSRSVPSRASDDRGRHRANTVRVSRRTDSRWRVLHSWSLVAGC